MPFLASVGDLDFGDVSPVLVWRGRGIYPHVVLYDTQLYSTTGHTAVQTYPLHKMMVKTKSKIGSHVNRGVTCLAAVGETDKMR